jgi:hypothetical protein
MTRAHLTPAELAARWHIHPTTLSNWRMQGRGPAYVKLGAGRNARVLYPTDEVEAYEKHGLKQQSVTLEAS